MVLRVDSFDQLDRPKRTRLGAFDKFKVMWLVPAPIGNHQLNPSPIGTYDHTARIFNRCGHRLFAENMFAGSGRSHHKLAMHRMGKTI